MTKAALFLWLSFVLAALAWQQSTPPWSWYASGLTATSFILLLVTVLPKAIFEQAKALLLHPFSVFLLITAVAVFFFPSVFSEQAFVSWDHSIHFEKTRRLATLITREHSFWGWSHDWFAGYPMGYHYPFFAYLLVLALKSVTFGALSLASAYNIVVLFSYILVCYSVFSLARLLKAQAFGLIFALLALFEYGGTDFGGFHWHMFAGVWPSGLATAFGIFFVTSFFTFSKNPNFRNASKASVLAAFALLAHPLQLLHFAAFAFAFCLTSLSAPGGLVLFKKRAFYFFLATTSLLASLWYLPYLASLSYASKEGKVWESIDTLGAALVQGTAVPLIWPCVLLLSVLGIVAGLFHTFSTFRSIALMPLLLVFTASTTFFLAFNFDALSESFNYIRFPRLLSVAKPYIFATAAFALAFIVQNFQGQWKTFYSSLRPSSYLYSAVVFALCLPLVFAAGRSVVEPIVEQYVYDRKAKLLHSYKLTEVFEWLKKHDAKSRGFSRYALDDSARGLDILYDPEGQLNRYEYRRFDTPAIMFKYELRSTDDDLAHLLGVRYLIAKEKEVDKEVWDFKERLSDYSIFEHKNWNTKWYTVRSDSARVKEAVFSDDVLTLQVDAEKGDTGSLLLHVSNFSRWHASVNEEEVPIKTESFKGMAQSGFMVLPLGSGSGEYIVRFVRGWQERLAPFLFLIGVLFALVPWSLRWKLKNVNL